MKKIVLLTGCFTLLLFGFSFSQTEEGAYLNVDYLKVEEENYSEFEELIQSNWKSLYESKIDEEKVTGWYFYRVAYPGGQAGKYNYVVISTYNELNTIVEVNGDMRGRLSQMPEDLTGEMFNLATYQFSELWGTEAGIMNTAGQKPGLFVVMNYMMVNPGKEAEYITLENDLARPLHRARIENGEMYSWRTYSLLKPGGLNYQYNFVTADYYEELNDIEYGFTNDIIRSVMPGTDITKMFEAIYATRDIVKSELWQLVDHLE
ncbi:MAG TPA: hypothetical protein VFM80_11845 [Gracilimonas sp.]|uniref:hypothetical protein n=1 Tax=Gracilimonas sp. TaxID=1974203 RepID=UPI002DA06B3D|nr:hypothetical protein [Gracilimonas sp.]